MKNGKIIKIPTASIIDKMTVKVVSTFSRFSFLSSSISSASSSSSSKYFDESVRLFIPSTSDSTKVTTPLIIGRSQIKYLSLRLLQVPSSTSISPSGFLTATAYLSLFFIMTPSRTACPPMPDGFTTDFLFI